MLIADLIFVWFLAIVYEERGDGISGERASKRIEHGGKREIREGVGFFRVVLPLVVFPLPIHSYYLEEKKSPILP